MRHDSCQWHIITVGLLNKISALGKANKVTIEFGQHVTSTGSETGEFSATINNSAQYIYVHESYATGYDNFDVCLIHLINGSITGTDSLFDIAASTGHADHVQAACLPSAAATHGDACWVAGWGTTSYQGQTATTLQEVGVNIFSAAYCVEKTGDFSVYEDEFCAGTPDLDGDGQTDAGRDSCQGDSGGPLVCNVNGNAVITGIVSRGVDCGVAGWAGRYGEVYDYVSWIQDKMQNAATVVRQDVEIQAGTVH